jgi:hypothetical protein
MTSAVCNCSLFHFLLERQSPCRTAWFVLHGMSWDRHHVHSSLPAVIGAAGAVRCAHGVNISAQGVNVCAWSQVTLCSESIGPQEAIISSNCSSHSSNARSLSQNEQFNSRHETGNLRNERSIWRVPIYMDVVVNDEETGIDVQRRESDRRARCADRVRRLNGGVDGTERSTDHRWSSGHSG